MKNVIFAVLTFITFAFAATQLTSHYTAPTTTLAQSTTCGLTTSQLPENNGWNSTTVSFLKAYNIIPTTATASSIFYKRVFVLVGCSTFPSYVVNETRMDYDFMWMQSCSNVVTCSDGSMWDDNTCSCISIPTCAAGSTWDTVTKTCKTDDSNGDGIPDKCDITFSGVATLDCDDDTIPNNMDGDMDDDGVPNSMDANPLDKYNTSSCPAISSGYYLVSAITDSGSCNTGNPLLTPNDGDLFYYKYANWDNCRNKCYSLNTSCPKGQAIKNGECQSVEPNIGDCAGTSSCRIIGLGVGNLQSCFKTCNCLTTSSPTPTNENNYFYEEVSCSENQTDEEKLNELKNNSDINTTVNKLDINGSVNNDTAASFKAALDSYAGAKETTALSQLKELAIQSLEAVKSNTILSDLKSLAENFFNISTSNDGVLDGSLNGIKNNTAIANNLSTESNSLLTDIKDLLLGDSNSTSLPYSESSEQGADRFSIDGKITDASNFLSSVNTDFQNLKNNLQNGITPASISAGTSPSFSANVFGRNIDFDLCSTFSRFASMFYYVFVLIFMFITIRIFYSSFKIGI